MYDSDMAPVDEMLNSWLLKSTRLDVLLLISVLRSNLQGMQKTNHKFTPV